MGGTGGNWTLSSKSSKELVEEAAKNASSAEFNAQLSDMLKECLAEFNDRDVESIQMAIKEVQECIEGEIEETLDVNFGGSVSKHTYVDGISDVDTLVVLNNTSLQDKTPKQVLKFFSELLKRKLENVKVETGQMTVTVTYPDGKIVQFLPALKIGKSFKVPSQNGISWSQIKPREFTEKLTKVNQKCSNNLVPTIKIVKAILQQVPEKLRPTGYHVESMAINAFKNYKGTFDLPEMTKHFFSQSAQIVKAPITDSTGQSVHVDEYLGKKNSKNREQVSHYLDRISKRMNKATMAKSISMWKELLGNT